MLAIIGGTGIYKIDGLEVLEEIRVDTPFGSPSAPVVKAEYKDKQLLFLPRHGQNHQFLPHEINYRANIFALKKMGARQGGDASAPLPATHCQPPLLLARSASTSVSQNHLAPVCQGINRCLVRKEAVIIRTRLCM